MGRIPQKVNVASPHGSLTALFTVRDLQSQDESTVVAERKLIQSFSTSGMWYIAFATSISSRHEMRPQVAIWNGCVYCNQGRYLL